MSFTYLYPAVSSALKFFNCLQCLQRAFRSFARDFLGELLAIIHMPNHEAKSFSVGFRFVNCLRKYLSEFVSELSELCRHLDTAASTASLRLAGLRFSLTTASSLYHNRQHWKKYVHCAYREVGSEAGCMPCCGTSWTPRAGGS